MKKFIANIFIFLIIVTMVDFLVGRTCETLIAHAIGGDTKRSSTIIDDVSDDILIFGSSRACSHYDPLIIQDSLHMSCYNVGREGTGSIIFNYGQYKLMSSRYKPKYIIYELMLNLDLLEDDKTAYLEPLKRYYGRPAIDSIFDAVDKTSRIKMMSRMYRYNGAFIRLLSDNIRPMGHYMKGYNPVDKYMNYEPIKENEVKETYVYDSLKLYYWQRFINDCQQSGTKLIFTLSPLYNAQPEDVEAYKPVIDMAQRNNIPVINHYDDTTYCTRRQYFKDTAHMNRLGATTYTKAIIKEIRPYMR